jgi:tetratricopeptide (TPR) repeat protein
MLTKEQLAKSLAIQKKLDKPVGLGAIFLKKGYITKEQLEEIVRIHNEEKDKTNGTAATDEKPKKKKKKKKKKDGEASESQSQASSESATAQASSDDAKKPEAKEEKKEEKKSSKTQAALDEKEKPLKKSGSTAPAVEASASQSDIDVALLESAPSDAGPIDEDDPTKRVISCQECKKKYRIKKKQAGKRFACRKCKAKVKIPKDLFDKPAAAPKKPSGAVAKVAEFSLDAEESSDGGAPAPSAAADAKKVEPPKKKDSGTAPATKKSGPQSATAAKPAAGGAPSIAELAKAAAEKKATPLGPKVTPRQRMFAYIQAVVFLGLFAGIVGGIYVWKQNEAADNERKKREAIEAEWDQVSAPYQKVVGDAKKVLGDAQQSLAPGAANGPSLEIVRDLTNAATAVEAAAADMKAGNGKLQSGDNVQKAAALLSSSKPEEILRDLVLTRGRVHLLLGRKDDVDEAVREFTDVVTKDKTCADGFLFLGRAELRRHSYAAAIDAFKHAVALKNEPLTHALLGVALEAGDISKEAIKEYEGLAAQEPIALVFKARAQLADGDADGSLSTLGSAKGDGEVKGAIEMRRGLALEKKGDLDGALRAFSSAASAGGKSGRALVARGEFLLRTGRFEEASKDFEAALGASGGARAEVGMGDYRAAIVDTPAARTSYLKATTMPVVASSALLLNELDAFDDPRGPDPRAVAQRHAGDTALALDKHDEARSFYTNAVAADPFDPESRAQAAKVEIRAKNLPMAETHVKAARALLVSAREHDAKTEAPLVRGQATVRVLLVEAEFWDAKGDLKQAERALDAAIQADPLEAGSAAVALKGSVLHKKGDEDGAAREYRKALDLETGGKDAVARFYAEAVQLLEAGKDDPAQVDKAKAALDAAIVISPKNAHVLVLRGKVALLMKKFDDALARFNLAVKSNDYYTDAFLALGFYWSHDLPTDRNMDEALPNFERAIALDPQRADCFYGRALVYYGKNNHRQALDDLNAIIDTKIGFDQNYAPAYELRAKVFRAMGQAAQAEKDEKRYKELTKK